MTGLAPTASMFIPWGIMKNIISLMKAYSCACIMVQADSSKKNKMLMKITTKDAAKKYLTLHNLMKQIFWQKGVFTKLMIILLLILRYKH